MKRVKEEEEIFWTIGDVDRKIYLGYKDNGCYPGTTLVSVSSFDDCERFDTFQDASIAMHDADVRYWRMHENYPKSIRPVKVSQSYFVLVSEKRNRKKGK